MWQNVLTFYSYPFSSVFVQRYCKANRIGTFVSILRNSVWTIHLKIFSYRKGSLVHSHNDWYPSPSVEVTFSPVWGKWSLAGAPFGYLEEVIYLKWANTLMKAGRLPPVQHLQRHYGNWGLCPLSINTPSKFKKVAGTTTLSTFWDVKSSHHIEILNSWKGLK